MISLTFLWKNGTNIANGKSKFGELRKSEFDEVSNYGCMQFY